MPLDRCDDVPVAALFALEVHGDDGVQRRHQQKDVKDQPEHQAWNDQSEIENRRERLPVEQ